MSQTRTVMLGSAASPSVHRPVEVPLRDFAPSGHLCISTGRKGCVDVVHVPTGLRIPPWGVHARHGDHPQFADAFRTKTAARAFMLALDGAGFDLSSSFPGKIDIRGIRDWIETWEGSSK